MCLSSQSLGTSLLMGEQEESRYPSCSTRKWWTHDLASVAKESCHSEPDGCSEILSLSFLLSHLWPDHVMVLKLSGLVKESCKYLFSPSLFLWCDFCSLVFPKPFSGVFFLSITDRREGINMKTQLSKVFRAGLQVLLAWPEIAPSPKTRSKWKCWEIQMCSLFSDNLTPHQPAALQPTLSTHPTQTSRVGNSNPLPGMGFNRSEKFK